MQCTRQLTSFPSSEVAKSIIRKAISKPSAFRLTNKEIKELEDAHPFDHGFPASFLFMNSTVNGRSREMFHRSNGRAVH